MELPTAAKILASRLGYHLDLQEPKENCPAASRRTQVMGCRACHGRQECIPLVAEGSALAVVRVRHRLFHRADRDGLNALIALATAAWRNAYESGYLADQAVADPLTGLPNRRGLERELSRGAYRGMFGVLMADIDHFKRVNDSYGHDAGDVVLGAFARCLKAHLRHCDTVARWGGEEFLILLPGMGREDLIEAGERLRQAVKALRDPKWPDGLQLTASFGGAVYPMDGTDPSGVITAADKALYRAKEGGRNQCRLVGE